MIEVMNERCEHHDIYMYNVHAYTMLVMVIFMLQRCCVCVLCVVVVVDIIFSTIVPLFIISYDWIVRRSPHFDLLFFYTIIGNAFILTIN